MRFLPICAAAGIALSALPSHAQSQVAGTIVIAHGGDSTWNARVNEVVRSVKTGGPVEVSYLMGPAAAQTRLQDVVARMEKSGVSRIVLVPMLVSSHSGHYEQIRYLAGGAKTLDAQMLHHLHMSGIVPPKSRVPISVARAMDDSPNVARVLTDRALALATNPHERAVLILGHGPNSAEDYAAWMINLRVVADSVKVWGGFRDVRVELVRDDAPATVRAEAVRRTRDIVELQALATGHDVLIVPVLVSKGALNRSQIPRDLAGLRIVYTGEPLLPHPHIARWIESRSK